MLPLLVSGLGSVVDAVRCQEVFDYSTYDQESAVRDLIGMGHPMDYEPPMLAPSVPTMVWGGQIRLMARALGAELDGADLTVNARRFEKLMVDAGLAAGLSDRTVMVGARAGSRED